MANYTATARSNYFAVKDAGAFKNWCATRDLDVWQGSDDNAARFAITPGAQSYCGGWPELMDEDDAAADDLCETLAQHLKGGEVAILFELGHEKLRYLVGAATAVHSSGRRIDLTLAEIYTRAREAFGETAVITEVNY
jgi:hypothetical protein